MYAIKRFPYDGTVDADGHVLEPAWLWERYLERRYVERAIRIKTDAAGLEYLELDGCPSRRTVKGVLGLMGAMGDESAQPSPERRYMDHIPYGAGDAAERIALLQQEHLEAVLLYPTIHLLCEGEGTEPEISLAYFRAYNRWIADSARNSVRRLSPIGHLSLLDPQRSAAELL